MSATIKTASARPCWVSVGRPSGEQGVQGRLRVQCE